MNSNTPTLEEALERLIKLVTPTGESIVPINEAVNKVAYQDIIAPINVPAFPRSMVDGYAINEIDCQNKLPLSLQKTKLIAAGDRQEYNIEPSTTIKIMTGAPVPINTGMIIKQEDVEEGLDNIIINSRVRNNPNIEFTGSIVKKGQVIIEKGSLYDPILIEQVAKIGFDKLSVYNKPQVYLINSGSELKLPGTPIEYGEIYNSNQSMFLSLVKSAGYPVIAGAGQLADDIDLICMEMKKGLEVSDVIIITGGNSKGEYDLIPAALQKMGAKIVVDGLDIRPGHNTVAATWGEKIIFNLPGNPHAGYILFHILISPILKYIEGIREPFNKWFDIPLQFSQNKTKKMRYFCRGVLTADNNRLAAASLKKSATFLVENNHLKILAPLILDIPPNLGKEGDMVKGMLI